VDHKNNVLKKDDASLKKRSKTQTKAHINNSQSAAKTNKQRKHRYSHPNTMQLPSSLTRDIDR
jgi:hypothetical protein